MSEGSLFKVRKPRGNIRKRETETEDDTKPVEAEIVHQPKRQLPENNPNVHQIDKKRRKFLAYEEGNETETTSRPSAQDLATATAQIDAKEVKPKDKYGPMKATANMRVTMRIDYQPDLCKDYYETGYCSFGDSCKFAHIREDYKSGWKIEQEYQEEQKKRAAKLQGLGLDGESEEEDEEEEGSHLPSVCWICRENFKDPVVTKCKHYFCESCAMDHFRITSRCAACDLPTNGIFNTATDIIKKMAQDKRKDVYDENQGKDKDLVEAAKTQESKPELCSTTWVIPHDFKDSARQGQTQWL